MKSINEIDWYYISHTPNLSEDFIRENKDMINWRLISAYQKLSEEFIREHKDNVDWSRISEYQILSESFIREFKDRVNWLYISMCQVLSEDFIREFKDNVDWDYISGYQMLSEDFIIENNLFEYDLSYQNLSKEFREKYELDTDVLFSVFNYGDSNRVIYRTKAEPDKIYIGDKVFTKDEAIEAISRKYKGKEASDYINKVIECFNYISEV